MIIDYRKFVEKGCTEKKVQGHGMNIICGDNEWGNGSSIFYCEKCLWKIIHGIKSEIEKFIDNLGGRDE